MMPAVSPEQRYRNAMRKARIRQERGNRDFEAGRAQIISVAHFERDEIIAAIGRAYRDGARVAREVAR